MPNLLHIFILLLLTIHIILSSDLCTVYFDSQSEFNSKLDSIGS